MMTKTNLLRAVVVEEDRAVQTSIRQLRDVFAACSAKRAEELIRFRTCCADPRASK
jgi:hypothetical protein